MLFRVCVFTCIYQIRKILFLSNFDLIVRHCTSFTDHFRRTALHCDTYWEELSWSCGHRVCLTILSIFIWISFFKKTLTNHWCISRWFMSNWEHSCSIKAYTENTFHHFIEKERYYCSQMQLGWPMKICTITCGELTSIWQEVPHTTLEVLKENTQLLWYKTVPFCKLRTLPWALMVQR